MAASLEGRSGAKPPSSPDAGRQTPFLEERLQSLIGLGGEPERVGEAIRPGRHKHELLQVDRVLGVRAAVDHVEHRHGQQRRLLAAQPAVEGTRASAAAAFAAARETPSKQFAPSRVLFGVPSSAISRSSRPR